MSHFSDEKPAGELTLSETVKLSVLIPPKCGEISHV